MVDDVTLSFVPIARQEQLIVEGLVEELLIYDLESHRAHALNPTASQIWRGSDGKCTVDQIASGFAIEHSVSQEEAVTIVLLAVEALHRAGLLHGDAPPPMEETGLMRRKIVRGLALVPVVLSIIAPTAAQAAPCLTSGQSPCTTPPQCCVSNVCVAPTRTCSAV